MVNLKFKFCEFRKWFVPVASKKLVSFSILLIVISLFFSCKDINKLRSAFSVRVADAVEVGTDWTEFVPNPPLTAKDGTQQYLELFFEYKHSSDNLGGEDGKSIILSDGKTARFDVYLYDDMGNEYELYINNGGEGLGFGTYSPVTKKLNTLPDVKYTKIKIRSSIPVKCEKIEWNARVST